MLSDYQSSVESVSESQARLKDSLNNVKFSYQVLRDTGFVRVRMQEILTGHILIKFVISCRPTGLFSRILMKNLKHLANYWGEYFGTFVVKMLVRKMQSSWSWLPHPLKIYPVLHVIHTILFHEHPIEIELPMPPATDSGHAAGGEDYVVSAILNHRKRGRVYQFLALMKGSRTHNAEWQPSRDFIDKDRTINEKFLEHIRKETLLPHLYGEDDH